MTERENGAPKRLEDLADMNPDGFLSHDDIKAMFNWSRATIRERELAGRFPERIYLSRNRPLWRVSDIQQYVRDLPQGLPSARGVREPKPKPRPRDPVVGRFTRNQ